MILICKDVLNAEKEKIELGPKANYYIKDVISGRDTDGAYMIGVFEGSGRFDMDFTWDQITLILDGELDITDRETGECKAAKKGDIYYVTKGSKMTFNSSGYKELYITHPPWRSSPSG